MTRILVYSSLYKRPYIGLISHFFLLREVKSAPFGIQNYIFTPGEFTLSPLGSQYFPSGPTYEKKIFFGLRLAQKCKKTKNFDVLSITYLFPDHFVHKIPTLYSLYGPAP